MPSYEPVEALLRGLRVLQAVNRRGPCRVADLQPDLDINRPTLIRMLETLMAAGYVSRSAQGALYSATPLCRKLSCGFRLDKEIGARAEPILARLQHRAGWPCDVAICDGVETVTVANSPKESRLAFNRPIGWTAPVLATSLGRAYISHCPAEERAAILSRLRDEPGSWNDLARDPKAGESLFRSIRQCGYATLDPQRAASSYQPNLRTIGVPVLVGGYAVASMNFIFVSQVIDFDEGVRTLLQPLKEAAAELGQALADLF